MKTIHVTSVIGGGAVDGAFHLQVEQEGSNDPIVLVFPADSLDAFVAALKGAPSKPAKKEAK